MLPDTNTIFTDIETGLASFEASLPALLPLFSLIPGFNTFAPYLELLPTVGQAVQVVQKATNASAEVAKQTIANHLTPGQPNAPALGPNA